MPTTEGDKVIEDTPKIRKLEIEARVIDGSDPWLSKDEIARLEGEGLQHWDGLDDEKRQAVVVLVRDALLRLIEDPDMWIPTSVVPESGSRLGVWVMIHFAEVDDEVVRRRVETEREIREARDDLVGLHGELRGDAAKAAQVVREREQAAAEAKAKPKGK